MTESSLYERLGGAFAIAAVVDHFSDAIVRNPIVGQSSLTLVRTWESGLLHCLVPALEPVERRSGSLCSNPLPQQRVEQELVGEQHNAAGQRLHPGHLLRRVMEEGDQGGLEADAATCLAGRLEARLEAIDGALGGTAYEGLGPAAGRLVGARDLLRRTVAIGGRPVSDVVPGV